VKVIGSGWRCSFAAGKKSWDKAQICYIAVEVMVNFMAFYVHCPDILLQRVLES